MATETEKVVPRTERYSERILTPMLARNSDPCRHRDTLLTSNIALGEFYWCAKCGRVRIRKEGE
jgi:hypothetical protein